MYSLVGDATRDVINIVYKEVNKRHNKKKIRVIIDTLSEFLIIKIQPFMYAIIAILIILFLMNCFQFYYYIKLTINDNFPHSSL